MILPEAEADIREALIWYEDQRQGLGAEFLGVCEAAMAQAVEFPMRWPVWADEPRYRRVVLRRFPYRLFYEVRDDVIEFVAVAHTSRDPGYWRGRSAGQRGL